MSEPIMDQYEPTNTYGVHTYKPVVTLGASTAFTARSVRDLTVTRASATTLKFTFPKTYNEVTHFSYGTKAATGTSLISWIITTNAIDSTGEVTLTAVASTGTATAPASGDVGYFCFGVSSDTLNDRFTASG